MVTLGPYDPITLIFSLINTLMKKKLLSYKEAIEIIKESLSPGMSEVEKDKLIKSIFIKTDNDLKSNS